MRSNNTSFNVLASYAYLGKGGPFNDLLMDASKNGICNVMIDSGAHTIHNAKVDKGLNLDGYCNYLEKYGCNVEKYVMLDVIKNHKLTKENYKIMLSRGYNPMFVLTEFDNDFDYLREAVSNNRHICVAGGVSTKSEWMSHRYYKVFNESNALIHGLGYVKYPTMYQLPLHSVDSSSWIQGAQVFGHIIYFDDGIKSALSREYLSGKKKLPRKLIEVMEKCKISPTMFMKKENHRGKSSIGTILSIVCYAEYQKLSKAQNQNLFLATCNKTQLQQLLYVNEHINKGSLTYENFCKI